MNVFAKIFAQIFDSSISSDHVVRHVFMDLLVLADRDGVVDMTLDAISRRTNVPEDLVAHAITELMKDDRKSRSHEEGGRRLIPIDSHRDWGWQIVNYEHYRNIKDEEARRTYFRDKKREQRAKTLTPSNPVKDSPTLSNNVTQGEGEGDTDKEKIKTPAKGKPSTFSLPEWIKPDTWAAFEGMRNLNRWKLTDQARKNIVAKLERLKGEGQNPEEILQNCITNCYRGIWPVNKGRDDSPPRPAQISLHTDEELEQERREGYQMWQSMSEKYRAANPWRGEVPQ